MNLDLIAVGVTWTAEASYYLERWKRHRFEAVPLSFHFALPVSHG